MLYERNSQAIFPVFTISQKEAMNPVFTILQKEAMKIWI
jgi:hypothetical protein